MLPEIKNIIKSGAEKKYPSYNDGVIQAADMAQPSKRQAYISGREEGMKDDFKFFMWVLENYYVNAAGNFYKDEDVIDISYTLEELYPEYKKL